MLIQGHFRGKREFLIEGPYNEGICGWRKYQGNRNIGGSGGNGGYWGNRGILIRKWRILVGNRGNRGILHGSIRGILRGILRGNQFPIHRHQRKPRPNSRQKERRIVRESFHHNSRGSFAPFTIHFTRWQRDSDWLPRIHIFGTFSSRAGRTHFIASHLHYDIHRLKWAGICHLLHRVQ